VGPPLLAASRLQAAMITAETQPKVRLPAEVPAPHVETDPPKGWFPKSSTLKSVQAARRGGG
jgi:hypothetical protein